MLNDVVEEEDDEEDDEEELDTSACRLREEVGEEAMALPSCRSNASATAP